MARENPTWGQERIANELLLKLGLRVSPRTVRKYLPKRLDRGGSHHGLSQRWRTFICNHARAIVACDFCVVVTASFRLLILDFLTTFMTERQGRCAWAADEHRCRVDAIAGDARSLGDPLAAVAGALPPPCGQRVIAHGTVVQDYFYRV